MEFIIIGAVLLVLILFFASGYLKAPPDTAYIISGLGKKRRILIGKAGFRVPFFERVDRLSLRVMQVDVKTSEAVPTNEFINVSVDGVANIKISSDPEALKLAAESLLGMRQQELISLVTQVLEGNMREIVGSVGLKEMVQDRQGVAKKITENVVPDMKKLGIEVVNFNIQNFKDAAGTIENMGIDNVEQIRKNAQIAKANAQRDIAIATAKAQEEANAVKVESEKKIAEQDAELAVQQADMKVKADTKKAEADAAYSIQQEAQRKVIEIAKTNADIARREKEAELAEKNIAIKERELEAEIKKQADAMKYRTEKEAEADLIQRQREAEAKKYEALQAAEAKKYEAEAKNTRLCRLRKLKKPKLKRSVSQWSRKRKVFAQKVLQKQKLSKRKPKLRRRWAKRPSSKCTSQLFPKLSRTPHLPFPARTRSLCTATATLQKLCVTL